MYLINDLFTFHNTGLVFYQNGIELNYLVLLIISPIIIIFYIKYSLKLKNNYANYYKVDILYKNKLYHLNGFLDTGNHLKDIYKKRNIILVHIKLNINPEEIIYTPYKTLNNTGILQCIKVDKLFVNKHEFANYLVGISHDKFKIDGIDCILHSSMKGRLE